MNKPYVLGIDPGFGGAVALTDGTRVPLLIDMPVVTRNGRKEVDGRALALIIKDYIPFIAFAVVENVGVHPDDGAVSMFRFGRGMGRVLGILETYGVRIIRPEPSVWKPMMGLSANKADSIAWAKKRYPDHIAEFRFKKSADKAEALALATTGLESF